MASGIEPSGGADEPAVRVPTASEPQGKDRAVGPALRSVYQATVDESIPDDLLDLLGKLS